MDHDVARMHRTPSFPGRHEPASKPAQSHGCCTVATVLDEVGLGLLVLGPVGEVAATNAFAEKLLTRRADDGTPLLQVLQRVRAGTSPGPTEQAFVEVHDEAGTRSILGYRMLRSAHLGTLFTLRDITQLERACTEHQAMERLSEVGRACAMVAHEIGNPLAAIKATLQSIEREAAAAGLGDPIAASFREIDRLDKLLGQLRGFVRHRPPRMLRTDLAEVIARAEKAAGMQLHGIAFEAPRSAIPAVLCDPDQMEQVFLNLFLNAADAMGGYGKLLVRASVAGGHLVVRVEDSGPGIPLELREKVLQSFFTTKPAGVGLGLSVCLRIMTDHRGSIAIMDRRGAKGASIRLTLPLASPASVRAPRSTEEHP